MSATLATRNIDGTDVLILKDGTSIEFVPVSEDRLTEAAVEECAAIAYVYALALNTPALPAPCHQVRRGGPIGWIRRVEAWWFLPAPRFNRNGVNSHG